MVSCKGIAVNFQSRSHLIADSPVRSPLLRYGRSSRSRALYVIIILMIPTNAVGAQALQLQIGAISPIGL
ncbi:hypothetical protein Q5691_06540 [Microcoleus sp. w1-18aA5]|uniref:hypothetical protein n=1 Tax=Microcoleus sp. w1-18aA5 TaxID=2818982 RepID=UPI002FD29E2D